jgi:hypothetical protein
VSTGHAARPLARRAVGVRQEIAAHAFRGRRRGDGHVVQRLLAFTLISKRTSATICAVSCNCGCECTDNIYKPPGMGTGLALLTQEE